MDNTPRIRINAKQTAKNLWQIEGTAEINGTDLTIPLNDDDVADVRKLRAGDLLLSEIKHTEKVFRYDGRVLVGDKQVPESTKGNEKHEVCA